MFDIEAMKKQLCQEARLRRRVLFNSSLWKAAGLVLQARRQVDADPIAARSSLAEAVQLLQTIVTGLDKEIG